MRRTALRWPWLLLVLPAAELRAALAEGLMTYGLSRDEIADIVREVLVEYGSVCEHTNDDGPTINVDVDEVSVIIAGKLSVR